MKPIDVSAALKAASEATAALQGLQVRKAEINQQIAALSARTIALFRAPLNRAELKQALLDDVDRRASKFREEGLKDLVAGFVAPRVHRPPVEGDLRLDNMSRKVLDRPYGLNLQDLRAKVNVADFGSLLMSGDGRGLNPDAVCFLVGDRLKQALLEDFDALCPDVAAPAGTSDLVAMPAQARRDEMQAIESRIEALHQEGAAVDQQIAEMQAAMKPGGSQPA
jgi:hypothetical protein